MENQLETLDAKGTDVAMKSFDIAVQENADSEEITFRNKNETRNLGSCRAFFYYKGDPLVIIGPDCKISHPIFFSNFQGPFSILMIGAISFFWYNSTDMLIYPAYPTASYIFGKCLQAYQLATMLIMVFKNPGWMSRDPDEEYFQDPRNDHVQGYLSTCA